uniref:Uncharacterized protein n=1 Tax=Fagus sylvatica TaxID=28930 RepID=A0A2N9ELZ3_FAGSY
MKSYCTLSKRFGLRLETWWLTARLVDSVAWACVVVVNGVVVDWWLGLADLGLGLSISA